MRLSIFAVALAATALPAAPALAHCATVHHRVHHVVRHHVVHHASAHRAVHYAGCGCSRSFAERRVVYPAAYPPPPPRVVEVEVERPLPVYRPYRAVYPLPLYRPRPVFYGVGYGRPWHRFGFEHRRHAWRRWR